MSADLADHVEPDEDGEGELAPNGDGPPPSEIEVELLRAKLLAGQGRRDE